MSDKQQRITREVKMKKLRIIGIVLLALLVCFLVAKDIIVKTAVSTGVEAVTGLKLDIKKMNIGLFKTLIGIKGLRLYNPEGFPDKTMIDMPEIYVDYNLGNILKKKVHLEEIRINLKEFTVVRTKDGKLNLDALKTVQDKKEGKKPSKEKEEEGEMPELQIDSMDLKIGKVTLKDYSKGVKPSVIEFKINIDEHYENITDPYTFVNLIIVKALMNTTIGSLINFNLGSLTDGMDQVLGGTTKAITGAVDATFDTGKDAGKAVTDKSKKAAKSLKKILPFGK